MHAMAAHPELPVTLLVRCYANNAFERHKEMFGGLDVAGRLVSLGIAGGTYASRAAELMKRFEFVVDHCQPAAVIVFDGSDAALSCGPVASRKACRCCTSAPGCAAARPATRPTSRGAWPTSSPTCSTPPGAGQPAARPGRRGRRAHPLRRQHAGRCAADRAAQQARHAQPANGLGLPTNLLNDRNGYGVVILDSAVNVGDRQVLAELINILRAVAHDVPLVWPMHSRTRELLCQVQARCHRASERIATLPSQSYPSLVQLMSNATCVITDSWSVQEEATILAVPRLTIGRAQERAITTAVGSNLVVGRNKSAATRAVWDCIFNGGRRGCAPDLWDGKAAERIAQHMAVFLAARRNAAGSRHRALAAGGEPARRQHAGGERRAEQDHRAADRHCRRQRLGEEQPAPQHREGRDQEGHRDRVGRADMRDEPEVQQVASPVHSTASSATISQACAEGAVAGHHHSAGSASVAAPPPTGCPRPPPSAPRPAGASW